MNFKPYPLQSPYSQAMSLSFLGKFPSPPCPLDRRSRKLQVIYRLIRDPSVRLLEAQPLEIGNPMKSNLICPRLALLAADWLFLCPSVGREAQSRSHNGHGVCWKPSAVGPASPWHPAPPGPGDDHHPGVGVLQLRLGGGQGVRHTAGPAAGGGGVPADERRVRDLDIGGCDPEGLPGPALSEWVLCRTLRSVQYESVQPACLSGGSIALLPVQWLRLHRCDQQAPPPAALPRLPGGGSLLHQCHTPLEHPEGLRVHQPAHHLPPRLPQVQLQWLQQREDRHRIPLPPVHPPASIPQSRLPPESAAGGGGGRHSRAVLPQ